MMIFVSVLFFAAKLVLGNAVLQESGGCFSFASDAF